MSTKEGRPLQVLKSRRKLLAETGACRSAISIFKTLQKAYGPQHWWPAQTPFEVIVGAILTQNTSWKNVEKAIRNLKQQNLLSFQKMLDVPTGRLARAIRPAGFFRMKAQRLKNFLYFLNQEASGSLKNFFQHKLSLVRKKLLDVNGIGPETADSILLYAAHKPIFVVDAYTRRIFSRLGFLSVETSYDEIQHFFMQNLPKSKKIFNEFHALIVRHAKRFCLKKPQCQSCPLRMSCDYYVQALTL